MCTYYSYITAVFHSGYSSSLVEQETEKDDESRAMGGRERLYGDGKFVRRGRTRYPLSLSLSFFGCAVLTIHGGISGGGGGTWEEYALCRLC